MVELRDQNYQIRRIRRTIRYKGHQHVIVTDERVLDLGGGNLSDLAETCRDPEAIARACGLASATNTDGKGKNEAAIYVIGVVGQDVAKIGISYCPVERFDSLQASNWSELFLYAIAWAPTRKAETVEARALEAFAADGKGLRGEWVAAPAAFAFEQVLKSAHEHDIPITDSAAWLANMNGRVTNMFSSQRSLTNLARRL